MYEKKKEVSGNNEGVGVEESEKANECKNERKKKQK